MREIFREAPGVNVSGNSNYHQRIFMRGGSTQSINVEVDGSRQNGMGFHHTVSLVIDPDLLSSVDVETGVNSVVGNQGALSGGIKFRTANASDFLDSDGFGGKIKLGYNSNDNAKKISLALYGRSSIFEGLASINFSSHRHGFSGSHALGTGQDNRYSKSPKTEAWLSQFRRVHIGGLGEDLSALLKLALKDGEHYDIGLSAELTGYKGLYPYRADMNDTDLRVGNHMTRTPQTFSRQNYTLHANAALSDDIKLESSGYFQRKILDKNKIDWRYAVPGGRLGLFFIITDNFGAKVDLLAKNQSDKLIFSHIAGVEHFGTKNYLKSSHSIGADKKATSRPVYGGDISNNLSVYYQLKMSADLEAGLIFIQPGLRYDWSILNTNEGDATKGRLKRVNYSFHAASGGLALGYESDEFNFTSSWTQLFKGIQVLEAIRLIGFKYKDDRANLYPDRGHNFEVAGTYKYKQDDLTIQAKAKTFYTLYTNTSSYYTNLNGTGFAGRQDSQRIYSYGVELLARVSVGDFGMRGSYSHTTTKLARNFYKNSTDGWGFNLSGVGDTYTLDFDYYFSSIGLLIGFSNLFQGEFNHVYGLKEFTHKPGYYVADLYAQYTPEQVEGLEINLGIYNLLNEIYVSQFSRVSDFSPGLDARISVAYKF